jgi:Tol biopolymer transport system component
MLLPGMRPPSCTVVEEVEFEVYPDVPPGYRLTTATRIRVPGSAAVQFGFVPLVPTATPTPTPSVTPSPTPTLTPTPSATPSPALTLTPTPRPAATEEAGSGEAAVLPPFIAYTQITETGPEIFVLDTSKDPPRIFALTETPGLALRPRWSPDVQFIAYLYQVPEAELPDLWLIDNAGGAQARPLTTGGFEGLEDFCWLADSRYLVFHDIDSEGGDRDIFRLDVESGDIVNLTADYPFWDSSPACSPGGEWIAFVSDRAENGKGMDNIWIMAPDGSDLQRLTDTEWEDVNPGWSPDSAEIAFYRWSFMEGGEGGPPGLWVTMADGSGARLVIELSVLAAGLDAPAWSPDGTWIAYQSGPPGEADVYVIPAEGGDPVNVSNLPGHEYGVSWSPDSSSLIFTNETDEDVRLYVAAPDGTDARPLLDTGGNGLGEWAPAFPVDE